MSASRRPWLGGHQVLSSSSKFRGPIVIYVCVRCGNLSVAGRSTEESSSIRGLLYRFQAPVYLLQTPPSGSSATTYSPQSPQSTVQPPALILTVPVRPAPRIPGFPVCDQTAFCFAPARVQYLPPDAFHVATHAVNGPTDSNPLENSSSALPPVSLNRARK